jgi:hypothetical protein
MNENQPVTAGMDKVLLITNSVVVQDNTGIREWSSGTSFCESVGRGFEPARPTVKSQLGQWALPALGRDVSS